MTNQNLVKSTLRTIALGIAFISASCEKENIATDDLSIERQANVATAAKSGGEATISLRNHSNWKVVSHNNFNLYNENGSLASSQQSQGPLAVTADRDGAGNWETLKISKLNNGKFAISGVNTKGEKGYLGFPNDKSRFSEVWVNAHFYSDSPWDGAEQFDLINVGGQGLDSDFIEVMLKCINGKFLTIRDIPSAPFNNDGKTCNCSGTDNPSDVWNGDKKSIFRLQLQNSNDKLYNYFTL